MLQKLFNVIVGFFVLIGSIFLVFRFGPEFESRFYPVVDNAALIYTVPSNSNELIVVSGYVTTERNCKLKSLTASLVHDNLTPMDTIKLKILSRTMIPVQSQPNMERWTLLLAVPKLYVDPDNVLILSTQYRCHRWWDIEQEIIHELIQDVVDSAR
jgi:hypothetical protein